MATTSKKNRTYPSIPPYIPTPFFFFHIFCSPTKKKIFFSFHIHIYRYTQHPSTTSPQSCAQTHTTTYRGYMQTQFSIILPRKKNPYIAYFRDQTLWRFSHTYITNTILKYKKKKHHHPPPIPPLNRPTHIFTHLFSLLLMLLLSLCMCTF